VAIAGDYENDVGRLQAFANIARYDRTLKTEEYDLLTYMISQAIPRDPPPDRMTTRTSARTSSANSRASYRVACSIPMTLATIRSRSATSSARGVAIP